MNLYLLRHGVSQMAVDNPGAHPSPTDPLSKHGLVQAKAAANRVKHLGLTSIICSSDTRAVDTAAAIAHALDLPNNVNPLFVEWIMPRAIFGRSQAEYSEEYLKYRYIRRKCPYLRFEDGESISDILQRVTDARSFLLSRFRDQNILVVSHYCFIKYFVSCELAGIWLADESVYRIYDLLEIDNATLTYLKYDPSLERFRLLLLNSGGHL